MHQDHSSDMASLVISALVPAYSDVITASDTGNPASAFRTCFSVKLQLSPWRQCFREADLTYSLVGGLKTGPCATWLKPPGKKFLSFNTQPYFLSFFKHCCDKKWMYNYCSYLSSSLKMQKEVVLDLWGKKLTNKSIPSLSNSACIGISEKVQITQML